ncbi:hypothetical protein KKC13_01340 [bacterium]|nr:hypothetical protein [bacterium]MBU1957011.1 hypothetical protein [bacterium]
MTYFKIIIGFLIWGVLFWFVGGSWLDERREDACSSEVRKEKPDLELIKKRCIQTADNYMEEGYYGSAAWFYLLGGDLDKNLNEVEAKIDDDFYMNIGHTYVLKGEFDKARKIYEDYIWYEGENYELSDDSMQEDYKILPRLYAGDKENLAKGLALWNEVYAPIGKIVTAYNNYETAEEEGNQKDAIKYLKQTLEYSFDYKDKEVLKYWERVESLAYLYKDDGQEEKAIEHYKKLEAIYVKDNEKEYEYKSVLSHIARLYSDISKHDQALVYYNKMLAYKEKSDSDNNASLALTYKDIGDVYIALKKPKKAFERYNKSIELQHAYLKSSDLYSLNTGLDTLEWYYAALSDGYLEMKDTKMALFIRKQYVSFLEEHYEGDYKPLATAHYNLAVYLSDRNNTAALKTHLMAIHDMEELVEREYEPSAQEDAVGMLFEYYNNLESYVLRSNDYNHTKSNELMVGYMEKFREFQENTFMQDKVNHLILAKTYSVMYDTYFDVNDCNNTNKNAKKSVWHMKKVIENEEDDSIKENYADFLNNYYGVLLRDTYTNEDDNVTEIPKEVHRIIDEYMQFQEKHYTKNFVILSQSHENVARFLKYRNAEKLAMEHYKKAFELAEKALKKEDSSENKALVSDSMTALLELYSENYSDYKEAIRLTKELIEIQKEKYADRKILLSSSYDALAEIYNKENNQSIEIVKNYRASIKIFKEDMLDNNSTQYFYNLRASSMRLSKYYAEHKEKEQSIATIQELIDFTIAEFPNDKDKLAKDYEALSEIYDLFEDDEKVLIYKEKAFSTIEALLIQSNNYGDYFNNFENHFDNLHGLYQKRNEKDKIVEGIEKLKTMLYGEHEKEYDVYLLRMISYAYLGMSDYKKSLAYMIKANTLDDETYVLECNDITQSYAFGYIYLNEKELKALEKVCGSL